MTSDEPPSSAWPSLQISLPEWIEAFVPAEGLILESTIERMEWVVKLAAENVRRNTGGPFAAAVFESESGRLVAPGVNLVVPSQWSGAHAEMIACALAQQAFGTHDLGAPGLPACELVTSVEPCAMCLGAIPWSGVRRVVYGARDADARHIGFDEGYKPRDWPTLLGLDGIEIVGSVCRQAAVEVLRSYAENGGAIYNGRSRGRK